MMNHIVYSKGVTYSVSDIMNRIESVMIHKGIELMNILKYDLKESIDVYEMHLLTTYRNMLLNKLSWCKDCFSGHSKEEISSKILKIIY